MTDLRFCQKTREIIDSDIADAGVAASFDRTAFNHVPQRDMPPEQEGASRVVIARETPIETIREMCKCGIDIEVFVYGAICISYSGQCLMSSAVNHRSANKGVCAQCCRLQYYPSAGEHFPEGDYILSPKDLNILPRLPELLEAGAASLKIEGRMKRPEYVWLVTRVFREAIDAYYANEPYELNQDQIRDLMLMFNRGFSLGHLFSADVKQRMSQYRPNHMGLRIGTVLSYKNDKVQVRLSDRLYQHDGLRILNRPTDTGLTAVRIEKDGRLVSEAGPGDVVWLDCKSRPVPKKGQPLQKTSDARLVSSIDHMIEDDPKTIALNISYTAIAGQPLLVTVSDEDGHTCTCASAADCQKPLKAPVSKERLEELLMRTGGYPYVFTDISGEYEEIFLPVSAVNETRRNVLDAISSLREINHPDRGEALPYSFSFEEETGEHDRVIVQNRFISEKENGIRYADHSEVCSPINQDLSEKKTYQNQILSEIGDLYSERENCIAGYTLNIANSYAAAYFLSRPGITAAVVSSEINDAQCENLIRAFEERYGFTPYLYRVVYGRRVLMYIKDKFIENIPETITDFNGNIYKVSYNNSVSLIYEPMPLTAEKGSCRGMYLLMDAEDSAENAKEIANEEISRRI